MFCWIIPLIVGILSALLGYLIGRNKHTDCNKKIAELSEKNDELSKQLKNCKEDLEKSKQELVRTKSQLNSNNQANFSAESSFSEKKDKENVTGFFARTVAAGTSVFEATKTKAEEKISDISSKINNEEKESVSNQEAQTIFGRVIEQDDLTIIEGIGPRAVEFFGEEGITTWKQISEMTPEACKKILVKAGGRFAKQDPTTWPEQAKLAVNGEWKKLFDWQEILDAGEIPKK
ncbi:hypothetical protein [Phocoenobacter atlanticus]|uniref:hypothetical protein n=1 Tax=Phocoenobacter atlanticus TaxID=3416742 RepID=UPI0027738BE2|nr:hypothetical protein [Pasteurella atlantica]MDP8100356.1 hypothetical protein [Pasteurella atlantica]